ncbi:precorrin-8X methylmutase [Vulcanisaeta sp. JCM 14467]
MSTDLRHANERGLGMPSTAIVLVGHGSRRLSYGEDIEGLVDYVRGRLGLPVYLAYNEYMSPDWRSVLARVVGDGFGRVVIGLVFLGRGNHVVRDIMGFLGVGRFNSWVRTVVGGREVEVYVTEPLATSPLVALSLYYRLARALGVFPALDGVVEDPMEIEGRSMSAILSRLDVGDERVRRVVARAVFASGNVEIARFVRVRDIDAGIEALRAGAEIVTDVRMVAAGIRWGRVTCMIDDERARELSRRLGITRAAAGVRLALGGGGKVVVVGNSPTALVEVIRLVREGVEVPFVVATPPGFTNAVEAKEALVRSGIPSIVVMGTYGGSGVAVAITNELIRLAGEG